MTRYRNLGADFSYNFATDTARAGLLWRDFKASMGLDKDKI
jgi:hypothetical protein